MLKPKSVVRDVHVADEELKKRMKAYIQGAVYCWMKNHKKKRFAVRDLFGGENYQWYGTPIHDLYLKHINNQDDADQNKKAVEAAGKDVGWLLKSVLDKDKRTFKSVPGCWTATYEWIGGED